MTEELYSDASGLCIQEILDHESDQFDELTALAGLNPATDFVGCNLSGTDFSGSDLRGFDFSGADLTDCWGTNVKWDDNTNLSGADLQDSMFEYRINERRFFIEHPEKFKEYERLLQRDWVSQFDWVADRTQSQSKILENGYLLRKLFTQTDDLSVQTTITYSLNDSFESPEEYNAFRLHILSNANASPYVVIPLLNFISPEELSNSNSLFSTIVSLFRTSDDFQLRKAIANLYNTSFNPTQRRTFDAVLASDELLTFRDEIFRKSLALVSQRYFSLINEAIKEPIDFVEPLPLKSEVKLVQQIAEAISRSHHYDRVRQEPSALQALSEKYTKEAHQELDSMLSNIWTRAGIKLVRSDWSSKEISGFFANVPRFANGMAQDGLDALVNAVYRSAERRKA